jgi:hypothetical protein
VTLGTLNELKTDPLSPRSAVYASGFLRDNFNFVLKSKSLKDLRQNRTWPISERADRLLLAIARHNPNVGDQFPLPRNDLFALETAGIHPTTNVEMHLDNERFVTDALVESRSSTSAELLFLWSRYLVETKHYLCDDGGIHQITPAGWERLERGPNRESHAAFVAMSFAEEMRFLFREGIEPAAAASGFKAERADSRDYVNRIDDEIIAMLRKARFCIADFTRQSNGAYFEAGFAQGLGLTVIWCCAEAEGNDVHFDTRQYSLLHWKKEDMGAFRKALHHRIEAVIGTGPLKPIPLS